MNIILTNRGVYQKSISFENKIKSSQPVYEVIRIIDGTPLFLKEHFGRLNHSLQIQDWKPAMEFEEFVNQIHQLIKLNQKKNGNIRFEYFTSGDENSWVFSFIPHSYPTAKDYQNGVQTDLIFDERENPNAKVIQNEIRERSNKMITAHNLFEVLLVDRKGMITEGSRSNVFFVKDEIFYTAPSSMVLVGITRQKVIECLKILKFIFIEEAVSTNQLAQFDAAFLTGTSPKVLPIRSIGNQEFNVQLMSVEKLMECYNNMIADYIGNAIKY